MEKSMRAIGPIAAALAVVALSVPAVEAQCATGAREFASIGGMQNQKLRVRTDGWLNSGQETARFWSATNSDDNNNFAGTCPSNDPTQTFGTWWSDETGNPNCSGMPCFGIRGAIAGTNCVASSCQDDPLVVFVEDLGSSGGPGASDTAYFFAARIDLDAEGAVSPRRWDFGLVDDVANGSMSQVLLNGAELPAVEIVMFGAPNFGSFATVVFDVPDPGPGVWAAVGTNEDLPDSAVIKSLDVCTKLGYGGDPGRERANWEQCYSIPYNNAVARDTLQFNCDGTFFIAAGITLHGGDGPDIPSRYVGRTTGFSCSSLLAEPEPRRPALQRQRTPPGPSRRR